MRKIGTAGSLVGALAADLAYSEERNLKTWTFALSYDFLLCVIVPESFSALPYSSVARRHEFRSWRANLLNDHSTFWEGLLTEFLPLPQNMFQACHCNIVQVC